MPELPEVENVAQGLAAQLIGQRLLSLQSNGVRLRGNLCTLLNELATAGGQAVNSDVQQILGQPLRAVGRRGRYIILQFAMVQALIIHLGMTGRCLILPQQADATINQARAAQLLGSTRNIHLQLSFERSVLWYDDARRFGAWELAQGEVLQHPWLARLGVEPLSARQLAALSPIVQHYATAHLTARRLQQAAQPRYAMRHGPPLKQFLMDNAVITGVGNIYATELLFAAGINPLQPADTLALAQWRTIVTKLRQLLVQAIRAGGSSVREYRHSDGSSGQFQKQLLLYGRPVGSPCPRCAIALERVIIAGRNSLYCPACQPLFENFENFEN